MYSPRDCAVARSRGDKPGQPAQYLVRREAVITGRDLKTARVGVDENNQPDVQFSLNPAGADKFNRSTGREHRPPARDHPRRRVGI